MDSYIYLQEHLVIPESTDYAKKLKVKESEEKKPESLYDVISDQEMVDRVFGFLPSFIGGQEGQAPLGFEVRRCGEIIKLIVYCNGMWERAHYLA